MTREGVDPSTSAVELPQLDDARQIVEEVFTTLLKRVVTPRGEQPNFTAGFRGGVTIDGAWSGEVVLETSSSVASLAAASFFGVRPDETTLADRLDALAELVNTIGGNLKTLLPGPSVLALPTVFAAPVSTRDRQEVGFAWHLDLECEREPLRLILRERGARDHLLNSNQ